MLLAGPEVKVCPQYGVHVFDKGVGDDLWRGITCRLLPPGSTEEMRSIFAARGALPWFMGRIQVGDRSCMQVMEYEFGHRGNPRI